MALLGSSVDPRLFMQDYSGFTHAAEMQAQGMQNLGASIGGAIESYADAKEKRKKIEASTKASRAGIESAIKLGDAYGIDIKSSLEPILAKMDDPNTTPMEAAMYGEEAKNRITNVLNMGITASEREGAQQRAMMEQQYKGAQLALESEKVDIARQKASQGPTPKFELRKPQITSPTGEVFEGPELPYDVNRGMYFDTKANKYIADPNLIGTGKEYAPDSAMPTPTSQVGGGAADLIASAAGMPAFTYKTRDQLPPSSTKNRYVSLDFNAASNPGARGIEVIVPNNASPEEFAAAEKYTKGTQQLFAKYGVNVPIRGVKTTAQNKRGSGQIIHLEPAFGADREAMAVLQKYPEEYAQVVSNSFGGSGFTVIPPHKKNDPGAVINGLSERGFATDVLIPAFERLSQQRASQANPTAIDNALSMSGVAGQQAMGTPEQQAEAARQIEQGQQLGLATAQGGADGAMPTEPSMAAQQPQLPQQTAPQWSPPSGFVPKQGKFRQFTPEEITQYGSQGQVNIETGEVRPIRPPSGMVIEQTEDGRFRVIQGSGAGANIRQEQAARSAEEQKKSTALMGTQEIGRALNLLNSGVAQGSGPFASFYRAGASKFVKGSPEYRMANEFITPIKGLVAFNKLAEMRSASPTGGALGNVAKYEVDLLEKMAGTLDPESNPQTLRENLYRLSEKYLDTIHGTAEDRRKLLQDGKITKDQYFEIESMYPAFTMGATGETVPRKIKDTAPQQQESEVDRILRELGE